jgi:hypothetical protein
MVQNPYGETAAAAAGAGDSRLGAGRGLEAVHAEITLSPTAHAIKHRFLMIRVSLLVRSFGAATKPYVPR